MITLTDGTTTITLPVDTLWRDELDWSPVEQSAEYMLAGSLDIQAGVKLAGRPITLGGEESASWMARGTILDLIAWAEIAGQELTLDYYGRSFTVLFRHQDAPAMEAKAVIEQVPPADEDWYWFTLKLMAV
jgi:hypothetical protein